MRAERRAIVRWLAAREAYALCPRSQASRFLVITFAGAAPTRRYGHPLKYAVRKSKMSWTLTAPEPLKSAGHGAVTAR